MKQIQLFSFFRAFTTRPFLIFFIFIFLIHACSNEGIQYSQNDKMVLIPAGTFVMGGNSNQSSPNEFPRHKVRVDSFYMDVHEVTNKQFKKISRSSINLLKKQATSRLPKKKLIGKI